MDSPLVEGDLITIATVSPSPYAGCAPYVSTARVDSFRVGRYQGQKAHLPAVNKLTLI